MSVGNKVLSIVKCEESYDNLKTSFADITTQVNVIAKEKGVEIGGRKYEVNVIIGGDYKVNFAGQELNIGDKFFVGTNKYYIVC